MLDVASLSPQQQCAALLAYYVNPDGARDRAAWLELHADVPRAVSLFEQVRALPVDQRLPVWERLAMALASTPLETRQDIVSDARELLRVSKYLSKTRKLLWVGLRYLLAGQPASATQVLPAVTRLPEHLDVMQAVSVCCFTAWLSDCIPQPELTVDLSQPTSVNEQWWHTVTRVWRDQHGDKALGLPPREKVDADLALRSLRVLQSLPPGHAAGLLGDWSQRALDALPLGAKLHPQAAEVLRIVANLLKVSMPGALRGVYADVPAEPPVLAPLADDLPTIPKWVEPTQPPEAAPPSATKPPPTRFTAPLFSASTPRPPRITPSATAPVSAPMPLFPKDAKDKTAASDDNDSPMDRPFSVPSRPSEVAFVFKASLLNLPDDADTRPPDGAGTSTDASSNEAVPPSPHPKRSAP